MCAVWKKTKRQSLAMQGNDKCILKEAQAIPPGDSLKAISKSI
jgi:hypothetical protein